MTVMDNRTKSSCRVKYRTEKDRVRGAKLDLLVLTGKMGV